MPGAVLLWSRGLYSSDFSFAPPKFFSGPVKLQQVRGLPLVKTANDLSCSPDFWELGHKLPKPF